MEHAFGRAFTLGVEEELLLVDRATLALAPVAERVLANADHPRAQLAHEAYAAELEARTPITDGLDEALAALAEARLAARTAGATLMGVGVHPTAQHGDARLVDEERYRRVGKAMRGLIQRTPECALHVHVGMPDPETAIWAFNGMRRHLPLLMGLAANSPWWFGHDSGMASARAALVRAYPGRGIPRAFHDWADYVETVEGIVSAGGIDDYTHLWWDLRPHPRLGTLEIREMDAQASLDDVAALVALVHALARHSAEQTAPPKVAPDAVAWSSFRAARDGLESEILCGERIVPLREAARETLEQVRPLADDAIEGVERILREGGGADRRRRAAARGGAAAMLGELLDETAGGRSAGGPA
jgi:glutamate---cysteine ligase / carboxylate-amine ligase